MAVFLVCTTGNSETKGILLRTTTMDCNKEEAIRAKDIAEKKMQIKDFVGAMKVVLKAQQLLPDLDNISQMLTVCEVHCSAGVKVNGEMDWYAILQVVPTADESSIKKQYRKLALQLHPDKNKFAGAEAAFKLIGEAYMTLSDQTKRSIYDMKRKSNIRPFPFKPSQPPGRKQTVVSNNIPNNTAAHSKGINQQPQPSAFSGPNTFWTICPFCSMRYQYYGMILNKSVRCRQCLKPFIACDLNAQAVPAGGSSGFSWNHSGTTQQAHPGNASSSMGFQGNVDGGSTAWQPSARSGINTEHGGGSTSNVQDVKADEEGGAGYKAKAENAKPNEGKKSEHVGKHTTGNMRQKRGRKIVESSDSDSSDSEDVVIKEVHNPDQQNAWTTGINPRRSTRQKRDVTYNENQSEDDDGFEKISSFKRLRKGGSSRTAGQSAKTFSKGDSVGVEVQTGGTAVSDEIDNRQKGGVSHEDNLPNGKEQVNKFKTHDGEQKSGEVRAKTKPEASSNAHSGLDSSMKSSPNVSSFTYPDPEFCDFEKEKDASQFAVDQIWAVYDDLEGMPRFYARIRSVRLPNFTVRFTWLEHNPIREAELAWSKAELPIACGNYTLGKLKSTQERLKFSHLMSWETGSQRNSYDIYPRKGEVWALFKDWDVSWSSDADSHRLHEYEVVEVLSDFSEGAGASVIRLVRVKGFVCLFMRPKAKRTAPLSIPPGEVLRFSHKVPSYRLTGSERKGVPEGSFELDSASLPANLEEAFPAVDLGDESSGFCSNSTTATEKFSTGTNKKTAELNNKNVSGAGNMSGGLSPKGVKGLCEQRQNQDSAGRHVGGEAMPPKHQVDEKVKTESRNADPSDAAEHQSPSPPSSPNPVSFEYPDSEFHEFKEERSVENLQCGQIWALYSDIDRYPNYYGRLKKVELDNFEVHVVWLEACPERKKAIEEWLEKDLPVACGTFKVLREVSTFDTTDAFSHLVQAKQSKRKDQYDIWPSAGEVWAIYKDWNAGWTRSHLKNCEYDLVEVLEQTSSGVKASVLTKVNGYRAVFMPESRVTAATEIPTDERLRFSHQIPAFRLTEERGGKLRGYWELDPASVPETFLFTNSEC